MEQRVTSPDSVMEADDDVTRRKSAHPNDENDGEGNGDDMEESNSSDGGDADSQVELSAEGSAAIAQGTERYEFFAQRVLQILSPAEKQGEEGVQIVEVLPVINSNAAQRFSRAEADQILQDMENENQVMYDSGLIYLI